eukprot:CAMPEP_0184861238 /NCGR_PEP_ID=MMETSP0580-20130426/5975_1 /TAXON_ID=1118495 /ORGANISM="Dactyliosolen fragilissimus" /LENGTH=597 /DNA_ID=CAMNT_0027358661 /DNA_START=327 /DNA_END=2120 /DNA_ORIENTATION=-
MSRDYETGVDGNGSSQLPLNSNSFEEKMTKDALEICDAAIKAVDPATAIRSCLSTMVSTSSGSSSSLGLLVNDTANGKKHVYSPQNYDRILLISFGKASTAMALETANILSRSFPAIHLKNRMSGIVIAKDDHITPYEVNILKKNYNIDVHEASHPIPDQRSVRAAERVLQSAVKTANKRTLVVTCISGGGSALFCSPLSPRDSAPSDILPTLTLNHLAKTNEALLASGMNIEDMNIIRKRLENGKGGKLAALCHPSTVIGLVLSDIIGDPLDLIASGPTVPDDRSTWKHAWNLVTKYNLNGRSHTRGQCEENSSSRPTTSSLPTEVLNLLKEGAAGNIDEDTPKSNHAAFSTILPAHNNISEKDDNNTPQDSLFKHQTRQTETVLVGNNHKAVIAAATNAKDLGYTPIILGSDIQGEASIVAKFYVSLMSRLALQRNQSVNDFHEIETEQTHQLDTFHMAKLPVALIAGGETTVTLPFGCTGLGGRNQEIGLIAALRMKELGLRNAVLASIGTDGTDGPTDAAGSIVDGGTIDRLEPFMHKDDTITAKDALDNHDSYNYFNQFTMLGSEVNNIPSPLIKTGPTGTNVADVCVMLIR